MKNLFLFLSLIFLLKGQAQEYSFVESSLRAISLEELMRKGPPNALENVFYEDGTKTTLSEVLPLIQKGELSPKMYVDGNGTYHTMVVFKPKPISFEELEANTQYSFIPISLRLLPQAELFKKPPPQSLDMVYYEDGTATTMSQVLPLMQRGELSPKMYVDKDLKYTALIVVKK
ncbi:hypothetical protein [Croceivirga thetidis]|uniref:Uncharacterized protein n=1 Tax=Croceivirga thetidis TaxID=2721623 RepID=A0ABX1GM93_9FLAO|nr:hypothetical protein [Croceivirga thetidis]NKI31037.1 hypothetical protein [Croceivirga thetidis]